MRIRLNGVEYDFEKEARKITVWQYLELEDETGITVDQLAAGKLSAVRVMAAQAYLIRRMHGEDVTFRQAAEELVPEEAIVADDEAAEAEGPTSAPTDTDRGDDDPPQSDTTT